MTMQEQEQQHDPHAGQQQPDAVGAETAPVAPAFEDQAQSGDRPPEDSAVEGPPPVTDPENLPQEPDEQSGPSVASEEAVGSPGVLVGTTTEEAPGVGGIGDHPAPAAMVDPETGRVRVAGEPPHAAASVAPAEDADVQAGGDVTDDEARERLNAVQEPEQVETERPDIGTE
jgi:hypothetical protein